MAALRFLAIALCLFLYTFSARGQSDFSIVPRSKGLDLVISVIEKIDSTCVFGKDKQILRTIAWAESQNGVKANTFRPGYYGGIWQVDQAVYDQTKSSVLSKFYNQFPALFKINWMTSSWKDLEKPLYSALAARLAIALKQAEHNPAASLDGALPWNTNAQANIWMSVYGRGSASQYQQAVTEIRRAICPTQGADIAFVLDSSGSIGSSNYQIMKQFVMSVVNAMDIGPESTQVAVVPFSNSVSGAFPLNRYSTKNQVVSAVSSLPYIGGGTNTADALSYLRQSTFTSALGARPNRPQLAIVLTDGASNEASVTLNQANAIHATGKIKMAAIGICDRCSTIPTSYADELRRMASQPVCQNVYQLQNFQDLAQAFAQEIQDRSCTEPVSVQLESMVTGPTGVIPPRPISFTMRPGHTQCTSTTIDTTTDSTIQFTGLAGSVEVYTSFTIPKPGPNVGYSLSLIISEGSKDSLYITPSLVHQLMDPVPSTATLYICFRNPNTKATKVEAKAAGDSSFEMVAVRGIISTCGQEVTLNHAGDTKTLSGPGYYSGVATGYPANLDCQWYIYAPDAHYIKINFDYVNLDGDLAVHGRAAATGILTVNDQNGHKQEIGSQRNAGFEVETSGNMGIVSFSNRQAAPAGYGFSMTVEAMS